MKVHFGTTVNVASKSDDNNKAKQDILFNDIDFAVQQRLMRYHHMKYYHERINAHFK